MLNIRISGAQFEQLSDIEKAHYVKKNDQYVLDTNGDTDEMITLRQQNVTLNQNVLRETAKAQQAEAKVATANADAEAKYKTDIESRDATIKTMRDGAITARRDAVVNEIAGNFTLPHLFKSAIADQVIVEYNEKGEIVETFKNIKGEAITLDALRDSYCKDPQYSAMLTKPVTTPTLPTNTPNAGGNAGQQPLFAPQFNQPNGAGGATANWGLDAAGKPVIHDYGKMTDAETSAYLAAKVAAEDKA